MGTVVGCCHVPIRYPLPPLLPLRVSRQYDTVEAWFRLSGDGGQATRYAMYSKQLEKGSKGYGTVPSCDRHTSGDRDAVMIVEYMLSRCSPVSVPRFSNAILPRESHYGGEFLMK
jgi:hypothetical protein